MSLPTGVRAGFPSRKAFSLRCPICQHACGTSSDAVKRLAFLAVHLRRVHDIEP